MTELPPPPPGYDPLTEEPPVQMLRAIGGRITAWSEGVAQAELPVGPPVINRQGVAHGGALMTLLDAACGFAGCYCPYPGRMRRASTLSMSTSFVTAAREGQLLVCDARVTGGGVSVYYADGVIRDGEGRCIATAQGVFKYRSDSRTLYGTPRR